MADQFNDQHIQTTISKLLGEVAKQLTLFLEKVLPTLFEDWWKEAVLNGLSFQQRRRTEQHGLGSLGSLDLAALLRVLDQNWYQISNKLGLTSEARHFVKEMQTNPQLGLEPVGFLDRRRLCLRHQCRHR